MRKRAPSRSINRSRNQPQENQEPGQMNTALHELFLDQLGDVLNAEQQLLKALPKMLKAVENEQLREAFETHMEETRNQVSRLEQVAQSLGERLPRKKCAGMEGLLQEATEILEEHRDSSALDAALIAAAQKVEHYEIATYGTLCAWAKLMGHDQALDFLKETLEEEENADEKLTEIAESAANLEAEEQEQD